MPTAYSRHPWRCLKFSIRTLLIFLTVSCVLLGWKVERARRQRQAVAKAREMGWVVNYDYECQSDGGRSRHNPPAVSRSPEWLTERLGIDFFHHVVRVRPSGADLAPLADLPNVKWVSLENNPEIVDLRPLTHLSDLKVLPLYNTRIKNLAPLSELTNLELLIIEHADDDDIIHLSSLPNLEEIHFRGTPITDAGLRHLKELTKLRRLDLYGVTHVTDDGIADIKGAIPMLEVNNFRS